MFGGVPAMLVLAGVAIAAVLMWAVWRAVAGARSGDQRPGGTVTGSVASGDHARSKAWRPVYMLAGAIALGGLAFLLTRGGDEAPRTEPAGDLAEQFPGPWRSDYRADLQRALSAAGAGPCQFHYREGAKPGEFLAYCPGTGADDWRAYLVWLPSGRTVGPLAPSSDIPAPE